MSSRSWFWTNIVLCAASAATVWLIYSPEWEFTFGDKHRWLVHHSYEFISVIDYSDGSYWELSIKALLIIFLVLPIYSVVNVFSQRRMAQKRCMAGCCIVCGYDLRGTPDRCPECSSIPTLKKGKNKGG